MALSEAIKRRSQELAWLSNGYYEICAFLCKSMIDEQLDRDHGCEAAMLFLCHHAIELHLKAAIVAAGGTPPNTHDLADLDSLYATLYPAYPTMLPETITSLTYIEGDLFPETTKELKGKLHERFRYPTRRGEQGWPAQPPLALKQFAKQIAEMRKRMAPVFVPIIYGSFDCGDGS
jgi:hypothetical protein